MLLSVTHDARQPPLGVEQDERPLVFTGEADLDALYPSQWYHRQPATNHHRSPDSIMNADVLVNHSIKGCVHCPAVQTLCMSYGADSGVLDSLLCV